MKNIIVLLLCATVCMLPPHTLGSSDGYDYYGNSDDYGYEYSAGTPAPVPALVPSPSPKSYITKQQIKTMVEKVRTAFQKAGTSPGEIAKNMMPNIHLVGMDITKFEPTLTSPYGLRIKIPSKAYCDIFDSVFGYNKDAHVDINYQQVIVKGAEIRRVALILMSNKSTELTVKFQRPERSIKFPISLSSFSKTTMLPEDQIKSFNLGDLKKALQGTNKYEEYFYEQMNTASYAAKYNERLTSFPEVGIQSFKHYLEVLTLFMDLFDVNSLTQILKASKNNNLMMLMSTVQSSIGMPKIMSFLSSGPVQKVLSGTKGLTGMLNGGGGLGSMLGNPTGGGGSGSLSSLAGMLGSGGLSMGSSAGLSNLDIGSLLGKGSGGAGDANGLGALLGGKSSGTNSGGGLGALLGGTPGGANNGGGLAALLGGGLVGSSSAGGLGALLGGTSGGANNGGGLAALLGGSSGGAGGAGGLGALLGGSSASTSGGGGLGALLGGSSGSAGGAGDLGAILGGDTREAGSTGSGGSLSGGSSGGTGGWGSLMSKMNDGTTGISSGKTGVTEKITELVAKIKMDAIKDYQQQLLGFKYYQKPDPLKSTSSCFCVAKNP